MPVVQQIRDDPVDVWITVDYDNQDNLATLYSMRCWNKSPVSMRLSVQLYNKGGQMTSDATAIVVAGQDRTWPDPAVPSEVALFPVNMRGTVYGIVIEPV